MDAVFEKPWVVESLKDCRFYHTIEIPGYGLQMGAWDLRDGIEEYFPEKDLRGMRVLDVGTANGFMTFELERRGADVVSFDLAEGLSYDMMPVHNVDVEAARYQHAEGIRMVKNGYWLAHRCFSSKAKVVYGHASDLPAEMGRFDLVFFGNVLQHLENPLRAIASASRLTDRIIVTEANWNLSVDQDQPLMYFLARPESDEPPSNWCYSWWQVTPGLLQNWFAVLGFRIETRHVHHQLFLETRKREPHFTIVASRSR